MTFIFTLKSDLPKHAYLENLLQLFSDIDGQILHSENNNAFITLVFLKILPQNSL